MWILVPDIPSSIMLDDDIELNIPICDLYISYVRHPDIILEMARLKKPLILGVLLGLGLLKQAKAINSKVVGPRTMCSLEPNTGIPEIDEYAKYFGKPEYELNIEKDGLIQDIKVNRSSPCGSSVAGARFISKKQINIANLQDFALSICHECRAPRFGHTCDKEVSGILHILSLLEDIEDKDIISSKKELISFINGLKNEYKSRTTTV